MKRHAALIALSREHHSALKLCRRARRIALEEDEPAWRRFANELRELFVNELDPHFGREETEFLPLLEALGLHALVERTRADHASLRQLSEALQEQAAADLLLRFGELMEKHVRFEERELFEAIELALQRSP